MWFSADLFFFARRPDGSVELCEEQVLLVSASDEDEARRKGEEMGIAKEHGYTVATGGRLEWKLHRVARVFELDPDATALQDGLEVFSRFLRESEVESLLTPFE